MYASYGTGYAWHPSGYLAYDNNPLPYGVSTFPPLPPGFFDYKLITISLRSQALPEFSREHDRFWYIKGRHIPSRMLEVCVDATEKEARGFVARHGHPFALKVFQEVHAADVGRHVDIRPLPFCQYTPLQQLAEGNLQVQPDYLQGAQEIARELLRFFQDGARCKTKSTKEIAVCRRVLNLNTGD